MLAVVEICLFPCLPGLSAIPIPFKVLPLARKFLFTFSKLTWCFSVMFIRCFLHSTKWLALHGYLLSVFIHGNPDCIITFHELDHWSFLYCCLLSKQLIWCFLLNSIQKINRIINLDLSFAPLKFKLVWSLSFGARKANNESQHLQFFKSQIIKDCSILFSDFSIKIGSLVLGSNEAANSIIVGDQKINNSSVTIIYWIKAAWRLSKLKLCL